MTWYNINMSKYNCEVCKKPTNQLNYEPNSKTWVCPKCDAKNSTKKKK